MKEKNYMVYIISAMNKYIDDNESDRYYYHILASSEKEATKIFNKNHKNEMIEEIEPREPWGKFIEEVKKLKGN